MNVMRLVDVLKIQPYINIKNTNIFVAQTTLYWISKFDSIFSADLFCAVFIIALHCCEWQSRLKPKTSSSYDTDSLNNLCIHKPHHIYKFSLEITVIKILSKVKFNANFILIISLHIIRIIWIIFIPLMHRYSH